MYAQSHIWAVKIKTFYAIMHITVTSGTRDHEQVEKIRKPSPYIPITVQ